MPKLCRDCKDWRFCEVRDYFALSDIKPCPFQVVWLLATFTRKREDGEYEFWIDKWMPDPSHTELASSSTFKSPFESIACLSAEINWRLNRTGKDGKELMMDVLNGTLNIEYLCEDARNALEYISGNKRRRVSYAEWKKVRKYRDKSVLSR